MKEVSKLEDQIKGSTDIDPPFEGNKLLGESMTQAIIAFNGVPVHEPPVLSWTEQIQYAISRQLNQLYEYNRRIVDRILFEDYSRYGMVPLTGELEINQDIKTHVVKFTYAGKDIASFGYGYTAIKVEQKESVLIGSIPYSPMVRLDGRDRIPPPICNTCRGYGSLSGWDSPAKSGHLFYSKPVICYRCEGLGYLQPHQIDFEFSFLAEKGLLHPYIED